MALTRKMLKAMGIEDDKIEQIIDAHTETVDALRAERDQYKEDASELQNVKNELESLKADVSSNDWKGKYDQEHESFENFKKEVQDKETLSNVKAAYKSLLSSQGVADKHINAVMKVTDFTDMKLKADGTLENVEDLQKNIKETWDGFIPETKVKDTDNPETPPGGGDNNSTGRAAQLAAKYRENLYGKAKED